MASFLKRPETVALIQRQVQKDRLTLKNIEEKQRQGRLDRRDVAKLKQLSFADAEGKLGREIRKAEQEIKARPPVVVETGKAKTIENESLRFFLAFHAVAEPNRVSFPTFPSRFGFYSSLSEFLEAPSAWLAELLPLFSISKHRYVSLSSSVRFEEYETEDYVHRVGSGETGLNASLLLHPELYYQLEKTVAELFETQYLQATFDRNRKHLIVLSAECDPFVAPEKRKIEPDRLIPDAFSHEITFTSLTFDHFHLDAEETGKDTGTFIQWERKLYRKVHQWGAVESRPEPSSRSVPARHAFGLRKPEAANVPAHLKPVREISPAADFLAKAGLIVIALSLLMLLYLKIFEN
ncbi:hypothetical protein [Roseibium sp. M-1]